MKQKEQLIIYIKGQTLHLYIFKKCVIYLVIK